MSIAPGVLSGGELSGVDFGQRLSVSQEEQFAAQPDMYDSAYLSLPPEQAHCNKD